MRRCRTSSSRGLGAEAPPAPAAIQTEVWERGPDGFLHRTRTKTVGEVYEEIIAVLGPDVAGAEEYLSVPPWIRDDQYWPDGRVVVFVVSGRSERHYLHIQVLTETGHRCVILGRTFKGPDGAWALARRLADLLGV